MDTRTEQHGNTEVGVGDAVTTPADKCPTCGRRFSTRGNGISASDAAEARKQLRDRARAESAIVALDRVLACPDSLLTRCGDVGDVLAPDFMDAVTTERTRLSVALLSPDALRAIYRRNEKARAQHG